MLIITCLVIMSLLLLSHWWDKKNENILRIYLIIWLVITISCGLNSETKDFNIRVYYLVIYSLIGFFLGYMSLRFAKNRIVNKVLYKNYVLNENLYKILLYFSFGFTFFLACKTIYLLLSGISWTTIRYGYVAAGIFMTPVENIIHTWIVLPIVNFVSLLIILTSEKKRKKYIVITVLSGFLLFFATQGKETFIYWAIEILFYYLHLGKRISKKQKRYFLLAGIIFIIVIVGVKYSRSGVISLGFIKEYGGIQFNLIDHWITYIDENDLMGYGGCFVNGVLNVPFSILESFGVESPQIVSQIQDNLMHIISTGVQVNINGRADTNVWVTQIISFYYDFREVGVFVESIIFGLLIGSVSKWFFSNQKTSYSLSLYILVAVGACCTIIYWLPSMTPYVLSMIYLRVFHKRGAQKCQI